MLKNSVTRFSYMISSPVTSKMSKEGKGILQQTFAASRNEVSASKRVLNNFKPFKDWVATRNKVEKYITEHSFVLNKLKDVGFPTANSFEFLPKMKEFEQEFASIREDIKANLQQGIAQDMLEKNKPGHPPLVSVEDYPTEGDIDRMQFSYDFYPLMDKDSLLVHYADELLQYKDDEVKKAEEFAKKDLMQKMYVAIDEAVDKLTNNKRLHGSILGNLKEFAERVKVLNPTDDQIIDNLAQEVYNLGVNYTIDEIREITGTKEEVIEKAKSIAKDLETYF